MWLADSKWSKGPKHIKDEGKIIQGYAAGLGWNPFSNRSPFSARLNLAVIKESCFCQTRRLACLVVMVGVVIRLREVEALED